ncbi:MULTISPECIES: DUF1302 domain-containing protein [Hydrocarboniphaga]|jgi:hypothetical protein|uniref:DUF1302 domain-containing protein n=1 Tax=Hydrocarboniphaga effusa AP103 TaxID=1172194 RepID=I8T5B1_9GAMM|nr:MULTISPECIES: DUF1302 domain-containing protein [Hydrocarboniphaga]EIT69095.1 hypothetical protein WQQ_26770 [Hydrocarboniphaga effusa AP103]MDZ4079390.1 DUF1302 domain-containing protein [Hydrocarboniphaga sp.]
MESVRPGRLRPAARARVRGSWIGWLAPCALALTLTSPTALATDFRLDFGDDSITGVLNTNLSIGAQWRAENRSNDLIGKNKVNPNFCPVAPNGAGTSCQGHLDYANESHRLLGLNSYIGEGSYANQVAVDAPGQFSNNNDDGNINYDQWDVTQAIGKLAMDLTLNYKGYDFFVRGYGFYDAENHNRKDFNPNIQTVDSTSGMRRGIGEASSRRRNGVTEDQIGVGAMLLDLYVAKTYAISDERDFTIKIGRQNINWGESTLLVVGSLNSFSTPNVNSLYRPAFLELSEVLQPTPAIWTSTTIVPNLTLEAFYQYDWEPAIVPTAGSYLSTVDIGTDSQRDYVFLDFGKTAEDPDRLGLPDQLMLSAITDTSGTIYLRPEKEAKSSGQFGFSLKYYAEWLNSGTEIALYAGRYHSRLPYLSFYEGDYGCLSGPGALAPAAVGATKTPLDTLGVLGACPGLDSTLFISNALPGALAPGVRDQRIGENGSAFTLDTVEAQLQYPENIDLYGISFNTAFGDLSIQGEIAYRPNQPLQIDDTDLAFAAMQNIFPRGNGTGTTGDSYDFGVLGDLGNSIPGLPGALLNAGTIAQLPGARYGIPDFVSAYRGLDPLGYAPGAYIRGWERFKTANYNLGATNVIGPNNWVAADQIILIGELGANQIFDMPSKSRLQLEGPGTFTHASAGADGTGADGSARSNSGVIGPSGIRFNPTQQKSGFVTDFSWGYRIISILRYENVLPGIGIEPTIVWSHDVQGVSPGPGENFVEGRKSVIVSTTIRFSPAWNAAVGYTAFFGGGSANLLRDRDFVQVGLRYLF